MNIANEPTSPTFFQFLLPLWFFQIEPVWKTESLANWIVILVVRGWVSQGKAERNGRIEADYSIEWCGSSIGAVLEEYMSIISCSSCHVAHYHCGHPMAALRQGLSSSFSQWNYAIATDIALSVLSVIDLTWVRLMTNLISARLIILAKLTIVFCIELKNRIQWLHASALWAWWIARIGLDKYCK